MRLTRFKKLPCVRLTLLLVVVVLIVHLHETILFKIASHSSNNIAAKNTTLLVNNSKCHIVEMDPFDSSIKNQLKSPPPIVCSNLEPLSYTARLNGRHMLIINKTVIPLYINNPDDMVCCFATVVRLHDSLNIKGPCRKIVAEETLLPDYERFLSVTCSNSVTLSAVYKNLHAVVQDDPWLGAAHDRPSPSADQASVLLVGIDSMSRLNLMRTMPRTLAHLQADEWVELRGYNKIGDNTFPNLMAILTGMATSEALSSKCLDENYFFDACPFIWKDFKAKGYVTAYAEDEATTSTFNNVGRGFKKQPTDFYFRPFVLQATQELDTKMLDGRTVCLGSKSTTDCFLQFGLDMARTFNESLYFSLIWLTNFSHNNQFTPATMDETFLKFFEDLKSAGALDTTVVVFLSDHGTRFGGTRASPLGWYEERLPFVHVWLPDAIKTKRPECRDNLRDNGDRLSSPYDLHLTLVHLLDGLGNASAAQRGCRGCPSCASLFTALPPERDCHEAGIPPVWCTCDRQTPVADRDLETRVAATLVDDMASTLEAAGAKGKLCQKPVLSKVLDFKMKIPMNKSLSFVYVDYLIMIETNGAPQFEATVRNWQNETKERFEVMEPISRLDEHDSHSKCVQEEALKKICYCIGS